jgi:uncharacterized Fe-S cluster-containing radical SAM superfamily protein
MAATDISCAIDNYSYWKCAKEDLDDYCNNPHKYNFILLTNQIMLDETRRLLDKYSNTIFVKLCVRYRDRRNYNQKHI